MHGFKRHYPAATLLFLGVALLDGPSHAQPPQDEAIKNWMAFMQTGENHKLLQTREGTWDLKVKMWTDPSQPAIESQAICVGKMIMGGRFLEESVKGEFSGSPFEGTGIIGYDNGAKKFVSTWIDNMSTGIMMAEGTFDAAKWSFEYKTSYTDPMTHKPGKGRSVERMINENSWVVESFKLLPDGKEYKDMEITYQRSK
jgi:hypothetical protein